MSDADIRAYSGGQLSLSSVKCLSYATTWDDVDVSTMKHFVQACGVDFASREQMRNANRYISKEPRFLHLRRDKNFSAFKELLRIYADHLQKQ